MGWKVAKSTVLSRYQMHIQDRDFQINKIAETRRTQEADVLAEILKKEKTVLWDSVKDTFETIKNSDTHGNPLAIMMTRNLTFFAKLNI